MEYSEHARGKKIIFFSFQLSFVLAPGDVAGPAQYYAVFDKFGNSNASLVHPQYPRSRVLYLLQRELQGTRKK